MRVRRVSSGNHEAEESKYMVRSTQLSVGCTGSVVVPSAVTGAVTPSNIAARDARAVACCRSRSCGTDFGRSRFG
jgi:hypothetical protein